MTVTEKMALIVVQDNRPVNSNTAQNYISGVPLAASIKITPKAIRTFKTCKGKVWTTFYSLRNQEMRNTNR